MSANRVTLLFTNDTHGNCWPDASGHGGLAELAALVHAQRLACTRFGSATLLLSAGDVTTGTPESDLLDGEPLIEGMNLLGYDAMAVGNHEFDTPLEVLLRQEQRAKFPFLCANIVYRASGRRLFKPCTIERVNGLRIALVGLICEDADRLCMRFPGQMLEVRSPIESARELIPRLRPQVDLLIVLSHLGYYTEDRHGAGRPMGDIELARSVPGIDVIVGGHTHTALESPRIEGGTVIVQAYEGNKVLGRLDLALSDGKVVVEHHALLPVRAASVPASTSASTSASAPAPSLLRALLEARLCDYRRRLQDRLDETVGISPRFWEGRREVIRWSETSLGHLVLECMREYTGADLAVISSGLIRTSIAAGQVTLRDILAVFPFRLRFATVTLAGGDLKDYLCRLASFAPGTGRFPQLADFAPLRGQCPNTARKLRKTPGTPKICDSSHYTLALTTFNARGGDDFPAVDRHPSYRVFPSEDYLVLKEFCGKRFRPDATAHAAGSPSPPQRHRPPPCIRTLRSADSPRATKR